MSSAEKAKEIRDWYNETFFDNEGPIGAEIQLTMWNMKTGRTFQVTGLTCTADITLDQIVKETYNFFSRRDVEIKEIEPIIHKPKEPKPIRLETIIHNRQNYYVEMYESGEPVIQNQNREVIDPQSRTYKAIIKKIETR
jgi:hypothetical protein